MSNSNARARVELRNDTKQKGCQEYVCAKLRIFKALRAGSSLNCEIFPQILFGTNKIVRPPIRAMFMVFLKKGTEGSGSLAKVGQRAKQGAKGRAADSKLLAAYWQLPSASCHLPGALCPAGYRGARISRCLAESTET